ncbi:hypothetical protein [Flavobacterium ginsengisoli]|nr:hypothetical protein [Flavobacterium ginsengisoli]
MSDYPVTPEENYKAIVEEMKALVNELENNPTMSEEMYSSILRRYTRLGKLLKGYADMIWYK